MRILIVSDLYPPHYLGGYEIRCQLVAENLQTRGHSVHVLTGDYQDDQVQKSVPEVSVTRALPYCSSRMNVSLWHNLQLERQAKWVVRQAIQQFQPDIIYIWNMWNIPLSAVLALEISGIPVVYQIDQNWMVYGKDAWLKRWNASSQWYKNIGRGIVRPLLRRANIVTGLNDLQFNEIIFLTNYHQKEYRDAALPIKKSHIVYTGIPRPAQTRQRTDFDRLRLLYVARYLTPPKGVLTAVKSMLQLHNKHVQLDIYGDFYPDYIDYNTDVQQLSQQSNQINLRGFLPYEKILTVYQDYDALVFCSSLAEGMPLVLAEAMYSGVPVISTALGGAAEMLFPQASLIIPPEDPVALTAAIAQLYSDAQLWRNLSEGARELAESMFSLEKCMDQTEAILEAATR